jgi:hypothetical protein
MLERYGQRHDLAGWTVIDVWTGRPVVIAGQSQTRMSEREASELTTLLNEHARRGNRLVLQ